MSAIHRSRFFLQVGPQSRKLYCLTPLGLEVVVLECRRLAALAYFRRPVSAGAPELFGDAESRAGKYRSLLVVLAILLVANLGNLPGLFDGGFISRTSLIGRVAITVQVCVAVLLAYATVRLALYIRRIRAQRDGR